MKRLFWLLLFLPSLAAAEGTKIPRHKEPAIQLEFENVYHNLSALSQATAGITSSSTEVCIDSPTFCVDITNNQVEVTSGTVGNPSYSFADDPDSGIYLRADGQISVAIAGAEATRTTANAFTGLVPLRVPDGTVSVPGFAFGDDADSGIYRTGADAWSLAANATRIFSINGGGINSRVPHAFEDGTASAPSITFTSDSNTGIYRPTTDVLAITTGGTARFFFQTDHNYTNRNLNPNADNTFSLGRTGERYTAVWATNGTIQTSTLKLKREVKDLKVSDIPRGIEFKWKDKQGKKDDRTFIGFVADGFPDAAYPENEDGTLDKDNIYTGAVIGILCATVRDLQKRIEELEARPGR